ncbi:hypothetical protein M0657_011218 [Pyricularia oryzae]|nr:hypothetical protein M0657_011218 [Pyricularia oryzae]
MTAEQIEYYQQKVDNWWYGMLPVSQAVDDAVAQTSGTKPYKSEFLSASPLETEKKKKVKAMQKKRKEKDFYHRLRSVISEIISVVVAFN